MERSKKSQAPSRMNNMVAWLRQNPLAMAIMGILFLLAVVGFLSPDRTPAMVLPVASEQPVQSARDEGVTVAVPNSAADAAVKENHGSVNVAGGHALVDTNYGTVNVGEVNILPESKPVAQTERIVERVVILVPADAPAKEEPKPEQKVEQPSSVDKLATYEQQPKTNSPECDAAFRAHQARTARWRAHPGSMGQ